METGISPDIRSILACKFARIRRIRGLASSLIVYVKWLFKAGCGNLRWGPMLVCGDYSEIGCFWAESRLIRVSGANPAFRLGYTLHFTSHTFFFNCIVKFSFQTPPTNFYRITLQISILLLCFQHSYHDSAQIIRVCEPRLRRTASAHLVAPLPHCCRILNYLDPSNPITKSLYLSLNSYTPHF
jgi:hypothetical protein